MHDIHAVLVSRVVPSESQHSRGQYQMIGAMKLNWSVHKPDGWVSHAIIFAWWTKLASDFNKLEFAIVSPSIPELHRAVWNWPASFSKLRVSDAARLVCKAIGCQWSPECHSNLFNLLRFMPEQRHQLPLRTDSVLNFFSRICYCDILSVMRFCVHTPSSFLHCNLSYRDIYS